MLKRRSKTIAILTAFIFCLTFLGAAFVAPPVAEAAFTASVAQSNNVPCTDPSADPIIPNQNLGYLKVEVNVADWTAATGSQLLVSYPTKLGRTGFVGKDTAYADYRTETQTLTGVGTVGYAGVQIV